VISKYLTQSLIFNFFLLISFSISINNFVDIQVINYIFYVFFHLTFIYFLFYHYHYLFYFLGLLYGVLFDIFLINDISCHLFCFILLISIYILLKKYLFLLTSYQISITIFITLIASLLLEVIFAKIFNNIIFTTNQIIMYLTIAIIIFFPSIYLFDKLDK